MNRVSGERVHVAATVLAVVIALGLCQFPGTAQTAPDQPDATAPAESTDSDTGFLPAEPTEDPVDTVPGLDFVGAVINTVVALIVVLVLVLGLAYLLRRASSHIRRIGGGGIAVLAQVPIGPSQFLSVVDIGGEVIVLGVTEHSVTALSEIDDPALVAKLREDRGVRGPSSQMLQGLPTFKQWLQRAQHGDSD